MFESGVVDNLGETEDEAFDIEGIIDPRDTRPMLGEFIETAQAVLRTQFGPTSGHQLPAIDDRWRPGQTRPCLRK